MRRTANNVATRRVAILGAGYIAKYHVEAARAANADVCAVCDLNQERADVFARTHGIPKAYSSLDTMLAQEALDAVHVLLPPNVHGPSIRTLLEKGVDVLAEKPLCITSAECVELGNLAVQRGRILGVSHNFLFAPVVERLAADVRSGRLGKIEQVEIIWNKELGQVKGGPFGGWLFAHPANVLFEVGPHSFANAMHLVGGIDEMVVLPSDRVVIPGGRPFYRRWDIVGRRNEAGVRIRFSFADGYTQHYVQVRGTAGVATADIEQDTYVVGEHTAQVLDVDRYANVAAAAAGSLLQASETLTRFVLAKAGLAKEGAPFPRSIVRAVRSFYDACATREIDGRLLPTLAGDAVALAERVRDAMPADTTPASASANGSAAHGSAAANVPAPTVLVLGGTGFIGKALVRKLRERGLGVRLLARNPSGVPAELLSMGVAVAKGDLENTQSIAAALDGIEHVYHLARGQGETWDDYKRTDVEPTRRLAELCLERGVKRLFYTSSIAVYYAGKRAGVITESTPPHPGVVRSSIYARSKVEIEKDLLALHRDRGLNVVIFRPGIVLGSGGNPLHWGIAAWPFNSVSRLWGAGQAPLPIVLVDDCADAMVKALDVADIAGESFNLVGEANITAQQYLDELERCAGTKFKRVPTSSLRYLAEDVGKYVIKTIGRDPKRTFPSYANWDGRTFEARFDASRAKEKLAWHPTRDREVVVREGIRVPASEFLG